jgi:hypothetical protein
VRSFVSGNETLLATVAGTMGTLLGILVGFGGVYYIFLREHLAQQAAHTNESKFAICDTLRTLRSEWGSPGGRELGVDYSPPFTAPTWSYSSVDPDLEALVRQLYPSLSDAAIARRLAVDLMFQEGGPGPNLRDLMQNAHPDRPWKGRLFYWLLGWSVDRLTLASYDANPPPEVFPTDPTGLGFETWRKEYATLRRMLGDLAHLRPMLEKDYLAFTSASPKQPSFLADQFRTAMKALDDAVPIIDKHLDLIARDEIQARVFSATPLFSTALLSLVLVAFGTGVVIPFGLLVVGSGSRRYLFGLMISASLLSFLIATVLLAHALPRQRDATATYRRARWYRTLENNLIFQLDSLGTTGRTTGNLVDGALRSWDVAMFGPNIVESMRSFSTATADLRIAAERLDKCVVEAMRVNLGMEAPEGGYPLYPPELADEGLYDSWRAAFSRARPSPVHVYVGVYGPSFSMHDEGSLVVPERETGRTAFLLKLDAFQQQIVHSPERDPFLAARERAGAAAADLLEKLEHDRGSPDERSPLGLLSNVVIGAAIVGALIAALSSRPRNHAGPEWEHID